MESKMLERLRDIVDRRFALIYSDFYLMNEVCEIIRPEQQAIFEELKFEVLTDEEIKVISFWDSLFHRPDDLLGIIERLVVEIQKLKKLKEGE